MLLLVRIEYMDAFANVLPVRRSIVYPPSVTFSAAAVYSRDHVASDNINHINNHINPMNTTRPFRLLR
jgi:hypothetical protein